MEKSRVNNRPSNADFTSLTKREYFDSPQLFYPKPGEVKEIRFMGTNRILRIEVSQLSFISSVQMRYTENNVFYGRLFRYPGEFSL